MVKSRFGVGFRFRPSDEELISDYLSRRLNNHPLPSDEVIDCNIYGNKNPCDIFNVKRKHFIFTDLKKIGPRRVSRTAGIGTWHGNNRGVEIRDLDGKVIGLKKTFTFKPKTKTTNNEKHLENWIMHEFSVVGSSSDQVLCSIYKNGINTKRDLDSLEEEEEEEDLVVAVDDSDDDITSDWE